MGIMTKHRKSLSRPPKKTGKSSGNSGKQGNSWLYGGHAVIAALANPARQLRRLVLSLDAEETYGDRIDRALATGGHRLNDKNILQKQEIEALLPAGAVHQGIALLADPLADLDIEDIIGQTAGQPQATVIILDQATDPHNIGAILRSAAAFGAAAVIVPDRHSPEITGVMAKSASGALERVALVRVGNLARTMELLKKAEFWCIGLDGSAGQSLAETDLAGRVVLVLGAEGSGLRRLTLENCDILARVPINDAVESLNLSNAAAIALYERNRK